MMTSEQQRVFGKVNKENSLRHDVRDETNCSPCFTSSTNLTTSDKGIVFDKSATLQYDVTTFPSIPTITLNKPSMPSQEFPITSFHQNQFEQFHSSSLSAANWADHEAYDRCGSGGSGNNNKSGSRGRTTYSDEQILELEKLFSTNPYPTPQSRQRLARDINVPEGKVKIWFQNRRARAKKQRLGSSTWRCGMRPCNPAQKHNINNNNISMCCRDDVTAKTSYVTLPCDDQNEMLKIDSGQSSLSLSCLSICSATKSTDRATTSTSQTHSGSKLINSNLFGNCETSQQLSNNWIPTMTTTLVGNYQTGSHGTYPARFPVIQKCDELPTQLDYSAGNCGYYPTRGGNLTTLISTQFNSDRVSSCGGKLNFKHDKMKDCFSQFPSSINFPGQTFNVIGKPCYDDLGRGHDPKSTLPSNNIAPLLESPPPIRRFVFPFKNLLESSQIVPGKESGNYMEGAAGGITEPEHLLFYQTQQNQTEKVKVSNYQVNLKDEAKSSRLHFASKRLIYSQVTNVDEVDYTNESSSRNILSDQRCRAWQASVTSNRVNATSCRSHSSVVSNYASHDDAASWNPRDANHETTRYHDVTMNKIPASRDDAAWSTNPPRL